MVFVGAPHKQELSFRAAVVQQYAENLNLGAAQWNLYVITPRRLSSFKAITLFRVCRVIPIDFC